MSNKDPSPETVKENKGFNSEEDHGDNKENEDNSKQKENGSEDTRYSIDD